VATLKQSNTNKNHQAQPEAPSVAIRCERDLHAQVRLAAGLMLRSLPHRGAKAKRWPKDRHKNEPIVDPRLLGVRSRGRATQPGLELAIEAVQAHVDAGAPVFRACGVVARQMVNWWSCDRRVEAQDLERLGCGIKVGGHGPVLVPTKVLLDRLRVAYYADRRRKI
jgi:hypothetical protein